MFNSKKLSTLVVMLVSSLIFFNCSPKTDNVTGLNYNLKVKVDPDLHKLLVTATIQAPPSGRFYLYNGMNINKVLVNGEPAACHFDSTAGSLQYTVGTARVIDVPDIRELTLEYSGTIPDIINGVNMISADWVELAYYSAWYPIFEGNSDYPFVLQADLPEGYITTTNGVLSGQTKENGRNITTWKSMHPGMDMVLMGGPGLKLLTDNSTGLQIEMYYQNMPTDRLQSLADHMKTAMREYTDLYGVSRAGGLLRFVYAPRGGWGYSRVPLFLVSEGWASGEIHTEQGMARALHGSYHEMAHFWWMLANTQTPNDWINEGLAEFSAFRMSREHAGQAFADSLLQEYHRDIAASRTHDAIAETEGTSPDRYVNRYEKTTLMFWEAQQKFGKEKLDRAIRTIYTQFQGRHDLTTDDFLRIVGEQCGEDAAAFFRTRLYQKG